MKYGNITDWKFIEEKEDEFTGKHYQYKCQTCFLHCSYWTTKLLTPKSFYCEILWRLTSQHREAGKIVMTRSVPFFLN